jgi:hypothetical protein
VPSPGDHIALGPSGAGLSPSPADACRLLYLDDPSLTAAECAARLGCRTATAQAVRQALVDLGVLMPLRPLQPRFPQHMPFARPPWILTEGACVGHPTPDIFTAPATQAGRTQARRVCYSCHVRIPCMEWAVQVLPRSDTGIYGGTTANERAQIRRRRGVPPRPYGRPAIEAQQTCCGTCGLPLTGSNLRVERTPTGTRRVCRSCRRRRNTEAERARRARRREAAAATGQGAA